jgi:hypothetical protein
VPSVSKKQHNLMEAVAHSPGFAKKVGIPQSVGKDFAAADKGKKFSSGGAARQGVNQPKTNHGKQALFKEGGQIMAIKEARMMPAKMDKGGDLKKGNKKFGEHAIQKSGKTRGKNLGDTGKTVGIQSGAKRGKK